MPRIIYSLVRGEERMYLNAMSHEEAMDEAYHKMGFGSPDADSSEILAKLTREGFRIEREADYPYQYFREADGSEDLHAISLAQNAISLAQNNIAEAASAKASVQKPQQ